MSSLTGGRNSPEKKPYLLEAKMDNAEREHIAKIKSAETEYATAGPIHKKDIWRNIKRLKKELAEYRLLRGS